MLTCISGPGDTQMFADIFPVKWLDKAGSAFSIGCLMKYKFIHTDNCQYMQTFLMLARHSHVSLVLGSLEYPEINQNKVACLMLSIS